MSDKKEVAVKYGDQNFKFVRIERVYEITDGEEKLIRDGGDFILRLAGHTAGDWKVYKDQVAKRSFNTLDYQRKFLENNHYTTLDGRPASEILQKDPSQTSTSSSSTSTRPGAEPTLPPSESSPRLEPEPTATSETAEVTLESLNLTPEQRTAVEQIIAQRVLAATQELRQEIDGLKARLEALESGNAPVVESSESQTTEVRTDATTPAAEPASASEATAELVGDDITATEDVTATETEVETTQEQPDQPPSRRRQFRRGFGWWRRLNGIPPRARYWEADEVTGRRQWVIPAEGDRTEVREYYSNRSGLGTVLAVGAAALGLYGILHNWHDLEGLEHRKAQPVYIQKKIIQKKIVKKVPITTDQGTEAPTTTTESTTTTPEENTTTQSENDSSTTKSDHKGIYSPAGVAGTKGSQDRDEQLSGNPTYIDNHNGGNGLALGLQPNMDVYRNGDSYQLQLPNGKRFNISFDSQDKLTAASKQKIEAEGYEIGQAPFKFDSQNRGTVNGRSYSVIGDKDSK